MPLLCDAAWRGDLAAAKAALPGGQLDQRYKGLTPLMWAAKGKHVDVFELLLTAGADPAKSGDPWEGTVAHLAACDQNPAMIELLARANSPLDVNSKEVGGTPLHVAAFEGNAATVAALLAHDVQVDARGELDRTPLHVAAFAGHRDVVRELLAHGADRGLVDAMGRNPAHLACEGGHDNVVEELRWERVRGQWSASLDQADRHGWTPLALTAAYGRERCLALLGYHGLTLTRETSRSPLHWACFGGNPRCIERLLDLGLSPQATDGFGERPLDLLTRRVPVGLASRLGSAPLAPANMQELRELAARPGAIAIQVQADPGFVARPVPRCENGITLAVWGDGLVLFVPDGENATEHVGRIPPRSVERALAECAELGLFDQPDHSQVGMENASKRVTLVRDGVRRRLVWDGSLGSQDSGYPSSARRSFEDAWFLMQSALEALVPAESTPLQELATDGHLRGFKPGAGDVR